MASGVAEILERVFTTPNRKTGSLPPVHTAWVVFAHGTVFYSVPSGMLPVECTFEVLAEAACSALKELGPAQAGTEWADFNPFASMAGFWKNLCGASGLPTRAS